MKNLLLILLVLPLFLQGQGIDTIYQCGNDYRPKCAQCVVIDTCENDPQEPPIIVMQGYDGSLSAPIEVFTGQELKTHIHGWFINDKRYEFYKRLHSFAASEKMKGKESEIIAGFGGFLTQYEAIAKDLTDTSTKLDSSAERLKTAQDALNKMEVQVYELGKTNDELRKKLELKPTKQRGRWATPLFIGVAAGVVLGVLVN